jgi:DNA modification methylase
MRVEHIGLATLYLGDCREVLPTLAPCDLILTDPPYGVLDVEWDAMNQRELARFTMFWASYAAAQADTMITFFGEKTRRTVAPLLEMLYPEVRQLIWNKTGGEVAEHRLFYAFESAWLCHQGETWETCEPKTMVVAAMLSAAREKAGLSKGGVDMLVRGKKTGLCYRWEEAACLPTPEQADVLKQHMPLGAEFDAALQEAYADKERALVAARAKAKEEAARATDVLTFPPPTRKQHPCEKPVPLMERLAMSVPNARRVTDYFRGSGTTGVACMKLGREFVGVERDPKHFDTACRRIEAAANQGQLFEPARAEQHGLAL